jgi:hypothetical protein
VTQRLEEEFQPGKKPDDLTDKAWRCRKTRTKKKLKKESSECNQNMSSEREHNSQNATADATMNSVATQSTLATLNTAANSAPGQLTQHHVSVASGATYTTYHAQNINFTGFHPEQGQDLRGMKETVEELKETAKTNALKLENLDIKLDQVLTVGNKMHKTLQIDIVPEVALIKQHTTPYKPRKQPATPGRQTTPDTASQFPGHRYVHSFPFPIFTSPEYHDSTNVYVTIMTVFPRFCQKA